MKKLLFPALLAIPLLFNFSVHHPDPAPGDLIHTKWISPVSEDCQESLCFLSDQIVKMYSCKNDICMELGYMIHEGRIEISAFGDAAMAPESQLVLIEDNGVLRQRPDAQNTFPRVFVMVPGSKCE
jgi:hypothetical protein